MGFSTSLQARLQEREQEERELIADLVNLQDLIVEPKEFQAIGDKQIMEWIESIRSALTGDNLEVSRQAIRQFVAKIMVNAKAGSIFYTFPLSHLSRIRTVVPTGFNHISVYRMNRAIKRLVGLFYDDLPLPQKPITYKRIPKSERNSQIITMYECGATLQEIADAFAISYQRVHQIIARWSRHHNQKVYN